MGLTATSFYCADLHPRLQQLGAVVQGRSVARENGATGLVRPFCLSRAVAPAGAGNGTVTGLDHAARRG